MKCTLVVNQLNDPFYIDYDEEFARHIIKTSKEKGLIEEDANITELDANLVMQLFSPLVLSQWLLIDQTKEPCSSVSCPNGFCFVFRHLDGLLFLAINGDSTETEEFLHRKTQIFIRLMRFLFGPVSEEIGQSQYNGKKAKWEFLRRLMKTWSEMVSTEQAFLIEAIERLNVNQLVSEKCIDILERSVKHIQAAQEQPTQHAVLLVNSKLLALYSNRTAHELRPKDILSLMILSKTMYPQSDRLEDLFSKQYTNKKSRAQSNDDNSDGGEDEYHSAPATPSGVTRSRSSSVKSEEAIEHFSSRQYDRGGSVSVSDTDTIINSLVNTLDSSSNQKSSVKKDVSLVDMYKEKFSDLDPQEDDVETDGTETTQEIMVVDHVVVADVHNEQGDFDGAGESSLNQNELSNNVKNSSLSDDKVCIKPNTDSSVLSDEQGIKDENLVQANEADEENRGKCVSESEETKDNSTKNKSEMKGDNLEKSTDSLASLSCLGKEGSRTSTLSSDRGEGSAMEESSLPSLQSRSSSVMSNISKSYPALSLQPGSGAADIDASVLLEPNEAKRNKKNKENKNPRQSPRLATKPKRVPTPTSTVEASAFTIDTLQSTTNSQMRGNYLPQTIFLETSTCQYSPHNVHTAQVLPGVTIVLLSQAPRHALADSLYQVISNIQDLIYGRRIKLPRQRSLHVYEIINSLLGKLLNSLRKFKGREKNLITDIHARWEKEDVKHKLLDYLEKDSRFQIPPEVESPLMEIYKKLRELFSLLFLYPLPDNPHLWESISQLRVAVNAELLDYREYLNVKSQRNITMTSYFEKYPGLIHFVFVDRRLHQMTAPSLNISLKEGEKVNASSYLKDNIWRMYQYMMKKLSEGYTTIILREGDFYYSYFLWFEDSAGNALPVQESFKPSNKLPYPGILCGSFYRDIIRQCFPQMINNSVFCFEMFLMHVGSVHPQYIASHCKKLAVELWEMSGDAYSTLNLF